MPPGSSSEAMRIDIAAIRNLYVDLKEDFVRHRDREHEALDRRIDFVIRRLEEINILLANWQGMMSFVKWTVGLCMPLGTAAIIAFVVKHWQ
jgi:hypothetical protein